MLHLRTLWLSLLFFLTLCTSVQAQSEFKYSYMPKKVYENQLFAVTVIGIGENGSENVTFNFTQSDAKPLFEQPLIIRNGSDSFYTFYFQAKKEDIRIPVLNVSTSTLETTLPSQTVFISTLKPREDFCQVIATDMKIKNSQVSNYDEKSHIITLSIEAHEANLQDMALKDSNESGVDSLRRDFSKVTGEFYVVVPATQKELKFTYFNTIKNQYVFKKIATLLEDAKVTTQSDLNPKEDSFEKLKKYSLMTLSGFFILMFLFRRDFFYLVFGVISVITLLTLYIPHKKICVSQGAPLYILPTTTSTTSTKVDEKFDTLLLGEREGYKKVEYKDGIIGWIKNEDLCQN